MHNPMTLWYKKSATCLNEALPIGNGKITAMVYGGAATETIQLDDATFWSGEPSRENNRSDTPEIIKKTRELLLQHNYEEADKIGKNFVGVKHNYGTHMPLGNLQLVQTSLKESENLERSLDLFTGVAATTFSANGNVWHRECFASYPDEVIALRYNADSQAQFTTTLQWSGIENNVSFTKMENKDILIAGNAYETLHTDGHTGVSLCGRIRILTDGETVWLGTTAEIRGATELVLLIALETMMTSSTPDETCLHRLDKAEKLGFQQLLASHIADVKELMERVHLSLGTDVSDRPTDERIVAYSKGNEDSQLITLAFQYGRYLTLASSRSNSPLPTHMGGIWNDNIYNKQDSTQDMHIDMNLEMQYWPAFPCNLADCFAPMVRWMQETLVPSGEEAAHIAYGAGGWASHITSNPWGYSALGWAYNWGSFSFGGAWCATLLWDYFDFTRDIDFLRTQAYPILIGSAKFMLDYLFFDPNSGYMMTGPSYSPENHFMVDGKQYTLSLSTTCDVILIREIFTIVQKAARVLNLPDDATMLKIADYLGKLPPYRIGKHGQIQEWFYDFEEPIINHRHTSHLLGLYPFAQITPELTPKFAEAARVSIRRRLKGFEATSWGYNMFAGMFARLCDGSGAKEMLDENISKLAVPNLTIVMPTDVAMWAGTWELDGNTGFSGAVAEMIAQSHEATDKDGISCQEVRILPALPDEWADGEMRGLKLRGGIEINIRWQAGKLVEATLSSIQDIRISLIVGEKCLLIAESAGKEIAISADDFN